MTELIFFFFKTAWRDARHLAFVFPCSYFPTFSFSSFLKKSLNVLE